LRLDVAAEVLMRSQDKRTKYISSAQSGGRIAGPG
jgi:hypothetical protein